MPLDRQIRVGTGIQYSFNQNVTAGLAYEYMNGGSASFDEISETDWLLVGQNAISLSTPFLILVVFLLTVLIASFGLFAPRNTTVTIALFLCSLAMSGTIAMILEMEHPLDAIVRISGRPLHHAWT